MSGIAQAVPRPCIDLQGEEGEAVDALEQSTGVYALAAAMAKCMKPEDLTRVALLFTQLGTTLSVIAALQNLDSGNAAAAADDLTGTV